MTDIVQNVGQKERFTDSKCSKIDLLISFDHSNRCWSDKLSCTTLQFTIDKEQYWLVFRMDASSVSNKKRFGATKHCSYGVCNSDSRYRDRDDMKGVNFIPI